MEFLIIVSLTVALTIIFVVSAIYKDLFDLGSLLQSKYEYSCILGQSIGIDDYYVFNASINYSVQRDSKKSMNVDVIMQTKDSDYTDLVLWRADKLKENEIAISQNIAVENHISEGDKLFSKHIVTGEIVDYIVKQIVPASSDSRIINEYLKNGIIIMGYDAEYINNLSHNVVLFTKQSVNDYTGITEIVYRKDEIEIVLFDMLPYIIIAVTVTGIAFFLLMVLTGKSISHNFCRLVIMGISKRILNKKYNCLSLKTGACSLIISFFGPMLYCIILGVSIYEMIFIIAMVIICSIILIIGTSISKKRLWRC